ncbi:hypothetical protein LCGC14_1068810 [marine sediment metagenome]|uniref:BLUF domain-containing protein n=2 Tax=root TaxID=1 RepID=A0A831QJQ7_9FLAO|nr:BLUF domain-containing protein [Pricia sp.]HEA19483.1 BLUF domain-containing protein [Pricia antarctica]
MYALSYRSTFSKGYGEKDLESIREVAGSYNSQNKLTGCLFFHNNSFVQIIEGKKRSVLRLFVKISNDPRHHDVIFLSSETHSLRYFDGWSMGFYSPLKGSSDVSKKEQFLRNMLSFHDLANKSTSTLRCFWFAWRSMLREGFPISEDDL